MIGRLLVAVVTAGLLLGPTAAANGGAQLGVNLIVNGDAESADETGWTSSGIEAFDDAGRGQSGTFFFWGGTSPIATATQEIDVGALATSIAAGDVRAALEGRLGGWSTQADHAVVKVAELDGTGTVLDSFEIGPVTDTLRGNATTMLLRRVVDVLDPATRGLRVTLTATRFEGTNNDGSFDDLRLVLTDGPPPITSGANLLVNGDAETGTGSTASAGSRVPVAGWETTGSLTIVQYGTGNFPGDDEGVRVAGGDDFFAGGPGSATSTAGQIVDVSAVGDRIDAGDVQATVSALIGGFSTQEDRGQVDAIYRDASGSEVGRQTLGPVTRSDRASQTRLESRSDTIVVPAGTRSIEVLLTATRFSGTANDGYFDNVALVLDFAPATRTLTVQVNGPGTVASAPVGVSCGADCSESAAVGSAFTLTASPGEGGRFLGWAGCDAVAGSACTVTMGEDRTVVATFSAPLYDLSVELDAQHVVREGGTTTNHVVVRNGAAAVATGVVLTSAGATLVGAHSERATCDADRNLCTIGLIGPFDRVDLSLTFRAPRRGDVVTHTVTVTGAQTETSLRNNVASGTTLVGPARTAALSFSNVVEGYSPAGNAKIEFVAEAGAVNDLTVTAADGGFVFRDAGVTIVPTGGCRSLAPGEAWCPRGGERPAETLIDLGDGDDRLVERLVDLAPLVLAGAGDDRVELTSGTALGGAGDDVLIGGPGAETLDGGLGVDRITGGSGRDWLSFEDRPPTHGVRVDLAAGTSRGPGAESELFTGMENVVGSPGADTILGSPGENRISAGDGNDIVAARDGDDVVDGGAGVDALQGDGGDDWVAGGFGDDALVSGGAGDDRLEGGVPGDPQRALDEDDPGQDQLVGGEGDDLLSGGLGRDTLAGGPGSDTADYEGRRRAVDVDLRDGGAEGNADDYGDPVGDGGVPASRRGDSLAGIENVIGTAHNDELAGDESANRLYGRAGADTVTGRGGNDHLHGEGGDDTLLGGSGRDQLVGGGDADVHDGGDGVDTASYAGRERGVVVTLDGNADDGAAGESDNVLPSVECVLGGAGADVLVGSAAANALDGGDGDDVLSGRGGNDVLDGGGGADALNGDGGVDAADYSGRRAPVTVTLDGLANDGAEGERDNVATEKVRGGRGDDLLEGDRRANILDGGAGADLLRGGGGADTLRGGAGADALHGGAGADWLLGGSGDDRLSGDAGNDTGDGGAGSDRVLGGRGRDRVAGGGGGNDVVDAGGDAGDEGRPGAPPVGWNLGAAAKV